MISAHSSYQKDPVPCTSSLVFDIHSLPSPLLEWNSNPCETHSGNGVLYDIVPMEDFYAGAGFVSVLYCDKAVSNL